METPPKAAVMFKEKQICFILLIDTCIDAEIAEVFELELLVCF